MNWPPKTEHITATVEGGYCVPTLTLSLPTRYIHSVTEAVHVDDLKAGIGLLLAYLR